MRRLSETWRRMNRPAQFSYRKMAIGTALASTAIAIVINVVFMVVDEGLGWLPLAVVSSVIPGPGCYLTFRLIWLLNGENLSKMGHRW